MDNKIEIFKNEQFGEVRTILEGEKVLFCAADVAKALGYTNPNKAVNDHCRAITKRSTPISGKVQSINFIPEGDVYRLIIAFCQLFWLGGRQHIPEPVKYSGQTI